MEWRLDNSRFQMAIKATGAELSLLWDNNYQRNWIWQPVPGIWNNSATQLFPVVGQLIHDGLWQGDRFFPLSAHGFLRHQTFHCVAQDDTRLVIAAHDTAETHELWPFAWRVEITWQLLSDGISITWSVHNPGDETWGYSFGWHPGFALPIASELGWNVQFNSACTGPFPTQKRTLQISEPISAVSAFSLQPGSFTHGAVYFALGTDNRWAICSPDGHQRVEFAGNQPWLALWSVPGEDFLCVEPLSGTTDEPNFCGQIREKRGIQWLTSGETHCHRLSVRFPADSNR